MRLKTIASLLDDVLDGNLEDPWIALVRASKLVREEIDSRRMAPPSAAPSSPAAAASPSDSAHPTSVEKE